MRRQLSLAVLGVVAAGLMFASPVVAQAQCFGGYGSSYNGGYSSYGNYNNNAFYNAGYSSGYGGYAGPVYSGGYGGNSIPSYSPGFGGFGGGYGAVNHPTSIHFTPAQGFHTHGHIHVPHGSHSHVIRY